MPAEVKTAGSVYAELIAEQLTEERARKASIEARGLSVITTSGALVTLLFGLSSLVSGVEGYSLPEAGRWLLLAALGAFLLAAVAAIVANFPLRYREVSVRGLRRDPTRVVDKRRAAGLPTGRGGATECLGSRAVDQRLQSYRVDRGNGDRGFRGGARSHCGRSHPLAVRDEPRPWPDAFDGDLLICDAPIMVGMAAIGRQRWLSRILPALSYLMSTRLEIDELWADGVPGADTARTGGMTEITPTDDRDPQVSQELQKRVEAVAYAWADEALSDVAARSAATSFVIANHRAMPIVSHRPPITRAATASNGARRVVCVGAADLSVWLARRHLEPPAAWDLYAELSNTVAREQPGWRVPRSREDLLYWAEEAAAGRL